MARALSPARPGPAARPDRDTGPGVALHGVTKVYRRRGPGRAGGDPWLPLLAIALVCLVTAMLGSAATAAAALRDPGQTLATAATG